MPKRKNGGSLPPAKRARTGLKPVEKAQVKRIAKRLDNQGKQVCETIHVTPLDSGTGASYANHEYVGVPSNTTDLMDLLPHIDQGDNREQRLGSKIKLTSLRTKFFFHIPPAFDYTISSSSSIACRLLVLSSKSISEFSRLRLNWVAGESLARRYLRDGADETYFQGDLKSLTFPVNTALFTTHHDRRFTLNRGFVSGDQTEGQTHVLDVQKIIRLSLKVKSKYLRYSDGDPEATNYAPFAILLYAPCNGGVSTSTDGIVYGNAFCHTTWKNLM